MSGWSPPKPSRGQTAAIVLAALAAIVYSAVIIQQILLGFLPAVFIAVLYFAWRLLRAIEACADALQRIAEAQRDER